MNFKRNLSTHDLLIQIHSLRTLLSVDELVNILLTFFRCRSVAAVSDSCRHDCCCKEPSW